MGKAWGSIWSKGPADPESNEEIKIEENEDQENIEIQDENTEMKTEKEIVSSGESPSTSE